MIKLDYIKSTIKSSENAYLIYICSFDFLT